VPNGVLYNIQTINCNNGVIITSDKEDKEFMFYLAFACLSFSNCT